MYAVIALVVDLGDPVMAKILLYAELPLLQVRKYRMQRQLDDVRGGLPGCAQEPLRLENAAEYGAEGNTLALGDLLHRIGRCTRRSVANNFRGSILQM